MLPGVWTLRLRWAPSDGEVGDATLRLEELNITGRRRRSSGGAGLKKKNKKIKSNTTVWDHRNKTSKIKVQRIFLSSYMEHKRV